MTDIRKTLCLALALFMAVLAVSSCSGEGKTADTVQTEPAVTDPSQETTLVPRVDDSLPGDLDFSGEKVIFLAPMTSRGATVDLYALELSSEPVNDSVYNRELYVEDRLNVNLVFPEFGSTYITEIQKQANSGDDTYSAYCGVSHEIADFCFDGYYLDLSELDYLDLDKPWWNESFTYECSVKNHVFMVSGSLSLSLLRGITAVYFNKAMAVDYSAGIPELNDLYSIVDDGRWTIDLVMKLGGDIYRDLNGDQIHDDEDVYGIICGGSTMEMPWGAFDISIFEKDEDDWFVFNVNTEKLFTAYEKIYQIYYETPGSASSYIDVGGDGSAGMFADGNGLFLLDALNRVEMASFRNMKDDYGILPEPKYNEAQKEYSSYTREYSCYALPATNSHPDAAAAVLEALSSYSYNETVPTFLDLALKGRYMSDPESRKMIDILVGNVKIDAAWSYLEEIGAGYAPAFRYNIINKEKTFASTHASYSQAVKRALAGYAAQYGKVFGD